MPIEIYSSRGSNQPKSKRWAGSVNSDTVRALVGGIGTAVCATVCLYGASAAYAAPIEPVERRATVRYADLDLSRAPGRQTLLVRVRGAARAVCSPVGNDTKSRSAAARCVRAAIDDAVGRIVSGGVI